MKMILFMIIALLALPTIVFAGHVYGVGRFDSGAFFDGDTVKLAASDAYGSCGSILRVQRTTGSGGFTFIDVDPGYYIVWVIGWEDGYRHVGYYWFYHGASGQDLGTIIANYPWENPC